MVLCVMNLTKWWNLLAKRGGGGGNRTFRQKRHWIIIIINPAALIISMHKKLVKICNTTNKKMIPNIKNLLKKILCFKNINCFKHKKWEYKNVLIAQKIAVLFSSLHSSGINWAPSCIQVLCRWQINTRNTPCA